MPPSIFDLLEIGVGSSSSHTVGPMRTAARFAERLRREGLLEATASVEVELYGLLGATGKGHGNDKAVPLGLGDEQPGTVDTVAIPTRLGTIRSSGGLHLLGERPVRLIEGEHLTLIRKPLACHSNDMVFRIFNAAGLQVHSHEYYSAGSGFVVDDKATGFDRIAEDRTPLVFPFRIMRQLSDHYIRESLSISQLMAENEKTWHPAERIHAGLLHIWQAMQDCVEAGCRNKGTMPGGLKVRRHAVVLHRQLCQRPEAGLRDALSVLGQVNLYAPATNEGNVSGGRMVTAPTNGAAGIVPAVLHYYTRFISGANDDGVVHFLLTTAVIGTLYKENALISGAEVDCQDEVGVACSMAVGTLYEALGGGVQQIENAAGIGIEHNLGSTYNPVGGLVQVPCIEHNAMAPVKAIDAVYIVLRGDGQHFISLSKVIRTVRQTGADMKSKYKETVHGGLAVNIVEH